MKTSLLRKKSILYFVALIFLLLGNAYVVLAQGQITSQSDRVSGMCYIRTAHTNAPGLSGPDVGNGYARIVKPGVYTIEKLRVVCTKADYDTLIDKICAKNPYDTEQYMGGEVSDNISTIGGCTAPGCEIIRRCPIQPSPIPPSKTEVKSFDYPVAELGNCKSELACRTYCDKQENSRMCLAFVKKHNLASPEEIAKWEKFIDVASGGGPGGCTNEKECINYCEDASRIVECTDFVAKYNLASPQELAEMQKVAKAVKAGAALPGNCRNKAECISYCEDSAHTEECVSFLQKGGFMTEKEAGLVRKFKGKSPGDCAKGKESFAEAQKSCNAFCNDPTNQPICFRFLEEAGIMTAEEATQAGSLSDFQACIPFAPQEIQQCFTDNLGQDLFDAMKKGVLPLEGDDIEGFMVKIRAARQCVNRFADRTLATFTDNPEALSCINSELGKDYLEKAKRGEVKCGEAAQSQKKMASCIETAMSTKLDQCFSLACSEATACLKGFETMGNKWKKEEINPDLKSKMENKINTCVAEQIRTCLAKDCSGMTACINKLQEEGEEKKGEGNLDAALQQEMETKMTVCAKSQQGNQQPSSGQPAEQMPQQTPQSGGQIPQEYCASFASAPSCSYVGSPDSDNYKYCKQCYPDK